MELHPDADEKASTKVELLSALRFRNLRNKIDKFPPPYIMLFTKLIGDWPSIVNGGCRFALQAPSKFIDQVRILAKSKILCNHGRILLCPGYREKLYSTFGVNMELVKDSIWIEPSCNVRGLKQPVSIQPGLLEFNPKSVQTATIARFCSMMGKSQRFAILEWGLVNPEKISEFLHRMKVDKIFRSYYHGLYDSLRLLYRRIFDKSLLIVIQAEKHWET